MNENADTGIAGAAVVAPPRRSRLRPLLALWPFAARHRGRIALAFIALLIAALATLAVPIALRRMIDFGFAPDRIGLIDQYFAVMILVAAILAAASAARFYLVTTIGERVVADVRAAVFEHVTSLSAAFFDTALTGELISRLAADTTQIKSAVSVSVSTALRNMVLFLGSAIMMVVTSSRLSAFVLAVIPIIVLPLVAFGRMVRRRSRLAQDTLADASAYAAELMGAVRTLQAYTNEVLAGTRFRAAVERAYQAAVASTRARALLTAIIIFLVFASVVIILWVGAQDVLAGRTSPGRLGQFVLYAAFAAGGLSQLSDVWGELAQTAGAAERIAELLAVRPEITAPRNPIPLPTGRRGEVAFDKSRSSSRRAPARARSFICYCAFTTRSTVPCHSTACPSSRPNRATYAPISRWCRRTPLFSRPASRTTSGSAAPMRPTPMWCAPPNLRPRASSLPGCRRAWTRRSASAASRSQAVSANASQLRARSCWKRPCCCSTRRRRRSMPRARSWCRRRWRG